MADFDKDGNILDVILKGIAAGMVGNDAHQMAMARELIERRAADLSNADIESLRDASAFMVIAMTQAQKMGSTKGAESAARILAVLDRLLAHGGAK